MMTPAPEQKAIHEAFLVSVWIKGLVGVIQAAAGALLLLVNQKAFVDLAISITTPELTEDPRDPIATFLRGSALHWGSGTQHFASTYLILHGAIKILLVAALLRGKLWSYPVSIWVLGAFIAYQGYRYTLTHSPWLIALTALDVVVVALIWTEYRSHRM
jgi:uncharacterized membrane protein